MNISFFCNRIISKLVSKKKIIFVDFFDTVCFRHIHAEQVFYQWAKVLLVKIPSLNEEYTVSSLVNVRKSIQKSLREFCEEPTYEDVMGTLFEKMSHLISPYSKEQYIKLNLNIDVAVELGCQYGNKKIIELLKKEKKKGKKIYLVSDFYLPQSVYADFMLLLGIEDLFDDIFVSETCNKTKHVGTLYGYALAKVGCVAADVVMIGDNLLADRDNPHRYGIDSLLYRPYIHKIKTNIYRLLKVDYSSDIVSRKGKELYKNTVYEEYILLYTYFIKQLAEQVKFITDNPITFFSRGGYYLKKMFDEYQHLVVPYEQQKTSRYCYISRKVTKKAILSLKTDNREDYDLFLKNLNNYVVNNKLVLVDEGWLNHTQQEIVEMSGYDTIGFYIGSLQKDEVAYRQKCKRVGLLFDKREDGSYSDYFGIFHANYLMQEQILMASHGSVDSYYLDDGKVNVRLHEDEKETYLYRTIIAPMQERMFLHFKGLSVWLVTQKINIKDIALIYLKTILFPNKKRCIASSLFNENYVNNMLGVTKRKTLKDVNFKFKDLVINFDMHLYEFCKLPMKLYTNRILYGLYLIFASGVYCYVCLLYVVKMFWKK